MKCRVKAPVITGSPCFGRHRAVVLLAQAVCMSAVVCSEHHAADSVEDVKHLFIDGSIISNSSGVELVRHMPSTAMLKNDGRVIWPEHPWEAYQGPGTYGGVMQDGDGLYRCYYLCRGSSIGDVKTCLATSTDGVTWVKPVLNLVEWKGSTANNIIMPTAWSATGSVFLDENPAAPPSQVSL